MVAIGFTVFKDKILSGEKRQTIRVYKDKRYRLIKRKKTLHLYWKLRSKECELLKVAELDDIFVIRLYAPVYSDFFYSKGTTIGWIHRWDGERWVKLTPEEIREIVKLDGFSGFQDFYYFFKKTYGDNVYDMVFMVIRWR